MLYIYINSHCMALHKCTLSVVGANYIMDTQIIPPPGCYATADWRNSPAYETNKSHRELLCHYWWSLWGGHRGSQPSIINHQYATLSISNKEKQLSVALPSLVVGWLGRQSQVATNRTLVPLAIVRFLLNWSGWHTVHLLYYHLSIIPNVWQSSISFG